MKQVNQLTTTALDKASKETLKELRWLLRERTLRATAAKVIDATHKSLLAHMPESSLSEMRASLKIMSEEETRLQEQRTKKKSDAANALLNS